MSTLVLSVLCALLAACAISLIRVGDLFAMVALLGAFSMLVAVLFAVLGAVDVAFTEAVVGAGLSTILLVSLLARLDSYRRPRRRRPAWAGLVVAGALGSALLAGVLAMPPFGEPAAAGPDRVSDRYVESAIPETATPNVVTAVLADYRGFDTLIETAVILTAAISCLLVLGPRR